MIRFFGCVLLLLLFGCNVPEPAAEDESEPLYFETIGRGQTGAGRDTIETVVASVEDWDRLRAAVQPLAPFESVDFTQTMVALIALPSESGGYTIEVETVELLDGVVRINYLVSEPGMDCITPTALALPFQAILFRRADGDVKFVRRTEKYLCGM